METYSFIKILLYGFWMPLLVMTGMYFYLRDDYSNASKYFRTVINCKPFLETDKMRILFSKIKYYAMNDKSAFRELFADFKKQNKDIFWWKIVIDSSWSFMKNEIKKAMKQYLSQKSRIYLLNYVKSTNFIFWYNIRKNYYLNKIIFILFDYWNHSYNLVFFYNKNFKQKFNKLIKIFF